MIYAILAAVGFAAYVIYNKEVFTRLKISVRNFVPLLFVFLFLVSALFFPWFGEIKIQALELKYIGLFILMVILALSWNKLYYDGLKKESLAEFELITMLYPLATIFLAAVLVPYEWNIYVFIAGIVASLAMILTHIKRHHLSFKKMEMALVWCVLLMGLEAIVQRYLLEVFSPLALYCIRCGVATLFFPLILRPNWKELNYRQILATLILSAIAVGFVTMQLYAYKTIGVAFTILILMIQPVLVFTYAMIIRGEKFQARKIVAAAVIIAAIIFAYLMKGS